MKQIHVSLVIATARIILGRHSVSGRALLNYLDLNGQ